MTKIIRQSWVERIEEARKRGAFSVADYFESSNWNTCAISERKDRKISGPLGTPTNMRLYNLGIMFSEAIKGDKFDEAEILLLEIHQVILS